ncbi:hypothetical protein ECC02_007641 [Trypanosoma cruzi]|uniref:Uncharacterized protein n=1 Tax=Trypanosoma cruzi TaxID=5693 RepID=A0A7J6XY90_TRYCR|nr:hypothetical protein ECC02_007641 [Trypanosoma cruzi]
MCVCAWKKCSAASAEAQHENYTFSGFGVHMRSRNGELGAVCHVANAVHTCSNCAASCAAKEEGATVAFTMNVTTHKYAGPYELWRRQFPPDGTIHPTARSSDADRTGICQLPPPREGKDDTKSGGRTAPQVNAEPSRQHEDSSIRSQSKVPIEKGVMGALNQNASKKINKKKPKRGTTSAHTLIAPVKQNTHTGRERERERSPIQCNGNRNSYGAPPMQPGRTAAVRVVQKRAPTGLHGCACNIYNGHIMCVPRGVR